MDEPEVRYVEREGKWLAYEIFGHGRCDVIASQSCCPIDLMWELPQLASFMERLGEFARVIMYDPPGSGASDPISDPGAATLETSCDDVLAVLDAAGAQRATFFDMSAGVSGVMFAATYPHRVRSLIVNNLRSSFPEIAGMSAAQRQQFARARAGVESLEIENPRVAHDPVLRRWWGRARRLCTSPGLTLAQLEIAARVDVAPVLPMLRTPTLALCRADNHFNVVETARAAADRIPNARFVALPGAENELFFGETDPVLAEIERFLNAPESPVAQDRPLATVLFTDMVSSTEHLATSGDDAWRRFLDEHDETMSEVVADYRGRFVKQLGDGILATFDGPARAVRCAVALRDAASERGFTLRAGLHTGEIELRPTDVTGIAVVIAQRISDLAEPNEILVSRTVVDLTAGSGLQFDARGERQLKGVPGTWSTFAAGP